MQPKVHITRDNIIQGNLSPIGLITPTFIGQQYITSDGLLYTSYGLDKNQWVAIQPKEDLNLQTNYKDISKAINELHRHKTAKETTKEMQQQINNLVLNVVDSEGNAELLQARGNFNLLRDRLNNIEEKINQQNLPNLVNYVDVTYQGDITSIQQEGNIITYTQTLNGTGGIKIPIPMEVDKQYAIAYEYLDETTSTIGVVRPLLGVWKEAFPIHEGNICIISTNSEGANAVLYGGKFNTEKVKIALYFYELPNNNKVINNVYNNPKNPPIVVDKSTDLKYDGSLLNWTNLVPYYKWSFTLEGGDTTHIKNLKGVPLLKHKEPYYMVVEYSDPTNYTIASMSFNTISQGTWDKNIFYTAKHMLTKNTKYYHQVITPNDWSCNNLALSISRLPNSTFTFNVYIFPIKSDVELETLSKPNGYSTTNILNSLSLSNFDNNLTIWDFNKYKPMYTNTYTRVETSKSSFYSVTGDLKLYANKKYFFACELLGSTNVGSISLRTLTNGSWDSKVSINLTKKTINGITYLYGFFTPTVDIHQALVFNADSLTVGDTYIYDIYLYDVIDDQMAEILSKDFGYKNPTIMDNLPLSSFKKDLTLSDFDNTLQFDDYFKDKIIPMSTTTTNRTETSASAYFSVTDNLNFIQGHRYYIVVNLLGNSIFNSMYVKTITGGVWDNVVNKILMKKETPNNTYYEGFFNAPKDFTNKLYLNFSGGEVNKNYIYEVHVFDVTNPLFERTLKKDNNFYSPSIYRGLDPLDHYRDKVCCALGDSLTAIGSGGHYIQFTGLQLGLKEVHQCGVGGSTVSGSGEQCMWQDTRVNTLTLDSDYIVIMGGTNDAGYKTVSEEDFTLENCDTENFVGAYNVLLSKIYYKYLKLNKGYYDSINYSGVTQVDKAKDIKIFLITPPKTLDKNEHKRFIFAEHVRKIGKMWGLPVVDANSEMQMNRFNYPESISDKVHFGLDFHKNLANLLVGKIKQVEIF